MMSPNEFDAKLRLADATKAVNDKHLASSEVGLLREEVLLQFLHVTDSWHKVIDGGNALQTERHYMFLLNIKC